MVVIPRAGRSPVFPIAAGAAADTPGSGRGTREGWYTGVEPVGEVLGVAEFPGEGLGTRDGIPLGVGVVVALSGGREIVRGDSSASVEVELEPACGGCGIPRDGRSMVSPVAGPEFVGVATPDVRPGLEISALPTLDGAAGGGIRVTTGREVTIGGAEVGRPGPMVLSRVGRTGSVLTTEAPLKACVFTGTTPLRVGRDSVNVAFDTAVIAVGECMFT